MSYQVLARKWRPKTFSEVIGQGHVLKALTNALDNDRLHHAYLFTGTRGVGKTTLARVFAKALNCESGVTSTPCGSCSACEEIDQGRFVDLIEVDAASRTKVDETRELLDNVPYAPTRARFKIYLIDEVHMFSNHSFNALLKTLEEPPDHVKFLLATTDPKKLPVTILSRCLQFNLTRLGVAQLGEHLGRILEAEGVAQDPAALEMIAEAAAGSVRDALSLLDQAIAHGNGEVRTDEVVRMLGTVDRDRVINLLTTLAAGDGAALIAAARNLAEYVPDYEQVLAEILSLLRRVAVVHALGDDADSAENDTRVIALATQIPADECQLFYQLALNGRRDLPHSPDAESGFEMQLLRMLAFKPVTAESAPEGMPATPSKPGSELEPQAAGMPKAAPAPPAPVAAPSQEAASTATLAPPTVPEPPPATRVQAEQQAVQPVQTQTPLAAEPPTPVDSAAAGEELLPAEPETHAELPANLKSLDWTNLVDTLPLVGLARELARNSAVNEFEGTALELVVQPQFEKLAQQRHIDSLSAALEQHFARSIKLRVLIRSEARTQTPSAEREAERQAQQRAAEQTIEADPNVQLLRDKFGAEIETVRPQS